MRHFRGFDIAEKDLMNRFPWRYVNVYLCLFHFIFKCHLSSECTCVCVCAYTGACVNSGIDSLRQNASIFLGRSLHESRIKYNRTSTITTDSKPITTGSKPFRQLFLRFYWLIWPSVKMNCHESITNCLLSLQSVSSLSLTGLIFVG